LNVSQHFSYHLYSGDCYIRYFSFFPYQKFNIADEHIIIIKKAIAIVAIATSVTYLLSIILKLSK